MTDEELNLIEFLRTRPLEERQARIEETLMRHDALIKGEIARLRAENADMREIVQAVATGDATYYTPIAEDETCCFCGGDNANCDEVNHTPGCIVTKARELLQHPPNSSHNV